MAFIGGTGPEGLGLAMRMAYAGEEVIIGSRAAKRAAEAASKISSQIPAAKARGMSNAEAPTEADIVFIAVPYNGHTETLQLLAPMLKGKIVVDIVVPLEFVGGRTTAIRVEEGSAAEQAQLMLPEARVISGFHHFAASKLIKVETPIDADVIICGDDLEAKKVVMALGEKIKGVRSIDGGPLVNSRYVEQFTALLIYLNRHYKTQSAIRIVGI